MNLSLQQVTAFLRVAETGSFSRAAVDLGIAQPSVSRTIQSAEKVLGGLLFDRDTRNLQLTPLGTELLPISRRLVAEFDSSFGELIQFRDGWRGRIVVAALPSIAGALLPNAIAAFQHEHPNVEVTIKDALSTPVIEAVLMGVADLGLTVQPTPSVKLKYRELLTDEFLLICRGDVGLPERQPAQWSVFAEHPFVAMSPASSVRSFTDAALLQARVSIRQLYECAHLSTTIRLVAAGLGITALPRLTLPSLIIDNLEVRQLVRPVIKRSLGVVTRVNRPLTPLSAAFLSALESAVLSSAWMADADLALTRLA